MIFSHCRKWILLIFNISSAIAIFSLSLCVCLFGFGHFPTQPTSGIAVHCSCCCLVALLFDFEKNNFNFNHSLSFQDILMASIRLHLKCKEMNVHMVYLCRTLVLLLLTRKFVNFLFSFNALARIFLPWSDAWPIALRSYALRVCSKMLELYKSMAFYMEGQKRQISHRKVDFELEIVLWSKLQRAIVLNSMWIWWSHRSSTRPNEEHISIGWNAARYLRLLAWSLVDLVSLLTN